MLKIIQRLFSVNALNFTPTKPIQFRDRVYFGFLFELKFLAGLPFFKFSRF